MQISNRFMHGAAGLAVSALAITLFAGCQSGHSEKGSATKMSEAPKPSSATTSTAPAPTPAPNPVAVAPTPTPAPTPAPAPVSRPTVRIKAGVTAPFTDTEGNVWLADTGFADGETTERAADLPIANTKNPGLYRTERYSMTKFSYPLPSGKYTVKLHFAETYEGITGPGERVFSFNVEGQNFKDFDVWVKSGGGAQRAYIESVPVEITD